MTVRRDGYWDGTYARAGDSITVEDETLVETLEMAGFAVREAVGPSPASRTGPRTNTRPRAS